MFTMLLWLESTWHTYCCAYMHLHYVVALTFLCMRVMIVTYSTAVLEPRLAGMKMVHETTVLHA